MKASTTERPQLRREHDHHREDLPGSSGGTIGAAPQRYEDRLCRYGRRIRGEELALARQPERAVASL
jgi:hypothetical protein